MNSRFSALLTLTSLMGAVSLHAAQDLETSVPSNWAAAGGTLSISPNHYKMGSQSLKWDWTAGSTITIDTPGIPAADVLSFYKHTCDFWVWNGVAQPDSKIRVEFMNGSTPQYWFEFNVNYTGWRRAVRSFSYDMQKKSGATTTFTSVRITAPSTGSGSFYLDALTWVGPRFTRIKDAQNVDITGYYADTNLADYFAIAPNIAATAPTSAELAELNTLRSRWLALVKGSAAPSASSVNSASTSFAALNIVEDANGIRGQVIGENTSGPEGWMLNLARDYAWGTASANSSRDKVLQLVRHLMDQGHAANSNVELTGGADGYDYRNIPNALILMAPTYDAATKAAVYDFLRWSYKTGQYWCADWSRNSDDIYLEATQQLGAILFLAPDDTTAVQMLKGYKHWLDMFCSYSEGGAGGLKRDGLGFHHNAHYNNYMYAYGPLASALNLLKGTSFQVEQVSYEHLRDAYFAMMRMSAKDTGTSYGYFGNSICGRKPFTTSLTVSQSDIRNLGLAGGAFYGQSADPVVARAYNRRYGVNDYATFTSFGVEDAPDGFYQFNYSPLGIYRRANWVASMRAPQKYFWSSEIYGVGPSGGGAGFPNRYGRYQAYGALEILYDGGRAMSGQQINGWDWNQPPGTTTIVLPNAKLVAENAREDVRSQINFSGALAFADGQSGLYAGNFQEDAAGANHNPSFVWRKSWFTFGSEIVCLGSDISNNDAANPTVTTLFQCALPTQGTAITLDGAAVSNFPYSNTVADANAHWLLDSCGTGYIVPAGSTVKISRATQTSENQDGASAATTGDFSKAWIDHGLAPSGAGYEYAVLPGTDASAMSAAAAQHADPSAKPYTVIERDAAAHVVKWNATGQIGYAVYSAGALSAATANAGLLAAVQRPCLVMTKPDAAGDVTLSVVDPDLNFSAPKSDYGVVDASVARTLDLTVKGKWSLDTPPAGVSLVSSTATATVIRVTTQHGAAVHVHLVSADIPPVFSSSDFALPSTVPNTAYAGSLASYASDADADDVLTFTKVTGPAWLTVNADGTLSGTPLSSDFGTGTFTVRVTDASGFSADATASILVNTAPVFSASSYTLSVAPTGSGYSGSISSDATDSDSGDTLTYSKISGPSWLIVNSDGTLTGTPSSGDTGTATFTVRVTDLGGMYSDATLTIPVDTAPSFSVSPIALPTAVAGSAYSGSLAAYASDVDAGDTLTFTKGSGPDWLTVDADGTLAGTPESGDVGTGTFTVSVIDSHGLYYNATVVIPVENDIIYESFESGVVSSSWSSKQALSIVQDSVLGSGGALSVPTVSYTYAMRNFSSTSLANPGDRLTLSFVFRYTQAPAASGAGFRFGLFDNNGVGYNVILGTGGNAVLSLLSNVNYGAGGNGVTLASNTSVPSIADTAKHTMKVSLVRTNSGALGVSTVVDGTTLTNIDTAPTVSTFANAVTRNGNISAAYAIDSVAVVSSKNYAPSFAAATLTLPAVAADAAYSYSVAAHASDDDLGDKLTFTKVSGPAWLSVNADGNLTGTPASGDVGANTFTVRVTDLVGASADATVTIQVN